MRLKASGNNCRTRRDSSAAISAGSLLLELPPAQQACGLKRCSGCRTPADADLGRLYGVVVMHLLT